jgi:hypothetical protein
MGGDLVFGLTVASLGKLLRLCLFIFLSFRLAMCIRKRLEACLCTKTMYPLDVSLLVTFNIKLPLSKK